MNVMAVAVDRSPHEEQTNVSKCKLFAFILDTVDVGSILIAMTHLRPVPPIARDDIPALLLAAGVTPTPQRMQIAAILLERTQHLSADQVLARLGDSSAPVSKATVYNTLGLLAERGLIREVIVDTTKVFYDSNATHHHHFYNVDDGTLTDFPPSAVVIEQLPAPPSGTQTDSVDVVVRIRHQR